MDTVPFIILIILILCIFIVVGYCLYASVRDKKFPAAQLGEYCNRTSDCDVGYMCYNGTCLVPKGGSCKDVSEFCAENTFCQDGICTEKENSSSILPKSRPFAVSSHQKPSSFSYLYNSTNSKGTLEALFSDIAYTSIFVVNEQLYICGSDKNIYIANNSLGTSSIVFSMPIIATSSYFDGTYLYICDGQELYMCEWSEKPQSFDHVTDLQTVISVGCSPNNQALILIYNPDHKKYNIITQFNDELIDYDNESLLIKVNNNNESINYLTFINGLGNSSALIIYNDKFNFMNTDYPLNSNEYPLIFINGDQYDVCTSDIMYCEVNYGYIFSKVAVNQTNFL